MVIAFSEGNNARELGLGGGVCGDGRTVRRCADA